MPFGNLITSSEKHPAGVICPRWLFDKPQCQIRSADFAHQAIGGVAGGRQPAGVQASNAAVYGLTVGLGICLAYGTENMLFTTAFAGKPSARRRKARKHCTPGSYGPYLCAASPPSSGVL